MLVFGAAYFFAPQRWVEFFIKKIWPESGPIVLMPLFLLHLALSLIAWVICFNVAKSPYTYLIAGFLTLGTVKIACILPMYAQFRKVMVLLIETEKSGRWIFAIGGILLGAGFLYLAWMIPA